LTLFLLPLLETDNESETTTRWTSISLYVKTALSVPQSVHQLKRFIGCNLTVSVGAALVFSHKALLERFLPFE